MDIRLFTISLMGLMTSLVLLEVLLSHGAHAADLGVGSSRELDLEEIEREKTRNVVRLAATDQLNSEIITNRTRGEL